jgi:hypothetical protein
MLLDYKTSLSDICIKEEIMSISAKKIALITLLLLFTASILIFADGYQDFTKTYIVPAGFEVKSITPFGAQVGMAIKYQLLVFAYNSKTGEALLLFYEKDNPQPVQTVKFIQQ